VISWFRNLPSNSTCTFRYIEAPTVRRLAAALCDLTLTDTTERRHDTTSDVAHHPPPHPPPPPGEPSVVDGAARDAVTDAMTDAFDEFPPSMRLPERGYSLRSDARAVVAITAIFVVVAAVRGCTS
jgi:hypothetical protein